MVFILLFDILLYSVLTIKFISASLELHYIYDSDADSNRQLRVRSQLELKSAFKTLNQLHSSLNNSKMLVSVKPANPEFDLHHDASPRSLVASGLGQTGSSFRLEK